MSSITLRWLGLRGGWTIGSSESFWGNLILSIMRASPYLEE